MADMSAKPYIPTIADAFGVLQKITAIDVHAPRKIAATMLRIANKNRIIDNRRLNDPHMERMASFMMGAENPPMLKSFMTSSAFLGRDMQRADIDEMMESIQRYIMRDPHVLTKAGFNERETMLLQSRAVYGIKQIDKTITYDR